MAVAGTLALLGCSTLAIASFSHGSAFFFIPKSNAYTLIRQSRWRRIAVPNFLLHFQSHPPIASREKRRAFLITFVVVIAAHIRGVGGSTPPTATNLSLSFSVPSAIISTTLL